MVLSDVYVSELVALLVAQALAHTSEACALILVAHLISVFGAVSKGVERVATVAAPGIDGLVGLVVR